MRLTLALLLLLSGCATRPLTPAETALLAPVHGATLDATRIRLTRAPLVAAFPITYDARPPVTCRERIAPPQIGRVTTHAAGITILNRIFVSPKADSPDYATTTADALDLADAMFLVHEATHVWQWQNREITGFTPLRAFAEQLTEDDPYLFALDDRPFLEHGYEQQASLVEEYFCCAILDPGGARTTRLHALLAPALPVAPSEAFARDVILPWDGANVAGICA